MSRPTQSAHAERFRALHDRSNVLLLPNAWDAGSAARMLGDLGFGANEADRSGTGHLLRLPVR